MKQLFHAITQPVSTIAPASTTPALLRQTGRLTSASTAASAPSPTKVSRQLSQEATGRTGGGADGQRDQKTR